MISAIYNFALTTGANRVIRGARIEHVCGDPTLSPEKDYAFGMRIVTAALETLHRRRARAHALRSDGAGNRRPPMRLEMGTFPVTDIVFGPATRYDAGRLDGRSRGRAGGGAAGSAHRHGRARDRAAGRIGADLAGAGRHRAARQGGRAGRLLPGHLRPRHRHGGPRAARIAWPAWAWSRCRASTGTTPAATSSRPISTCRGRYGEMYPYQQLINLCLVVEPDPTLDEEVKNYAVHKAALTVADQLGEAVRSPRRRPSAKSSSSRRSTRRCPGSSTSGACIRLRPCRARRRRSARRPTA